MDFRKVIKAVAQNKVEWKRHAVERMFQRGISRSDVKNSILHGEIIEEYANDYPCPSALILGWVGTNPLHIVVAYDSENNICYIITAYIPDEEHFEEKFIKRKK